MGRQHQRASTNHLHYVFAPGHFTDQQQTWIIQAANVWDNAIRFNLGSEADVHHHSSGGAGVVRVENRDLGDGLGLVNCAQNELYLNRALLGGDGARWRRTAAHEFGHMLGLSHSGDGDNTITPANQPIMSTCLTNAQAANNPNQLTVDDDAQLRRTRRPWLTADLGFENGGGHLWTRSNATRVIASNPANGNAHMRIAPGGSVEQTVHIEWPNPASRTARIAARYRFASGASGTLTFKLYSRARNFPNGHNCAGAAPRYTNDQNFNEPLQWASNERLEVSVSPGGSPTAWTQSPVSSASWRNQLDINREMHRTRIYVYNNADRNAHIDDFYMNLA